MEFENQRDAQGCMAIAGLGWASQDGEGIAALDVSIYTGQIWEEVSEQSNAEAAGQVDRDALLCRALQGAWDDANRHRGPASANRRHTLLLLPEGWAQSAIVELLSSSRKGLPAREGFVGIPGDPETPGRGVVAEAVAGGSSFLSDALMRAESAFVRREADLVLVGAFGQLPQGGDPIGQGTREDEGSGTDDGERNRSPVGIAVALEWVTGSEGAEAYAILSRSDHPFGPGVQEPHPWEKDLAGSSLRAKGQVGLVAVVVTKGQPGNWILEGSGAEKPSSIERQPQDKRTDRWPLTSRPVEMVEGAGSLCVLIPALAADKADYPLASLIAMTEVSLALAHGYLPRVTPRPRSEAAGFVCAGGSLLLPDSSRPWFTSPARPRRIAMLLLPQARRDSQSEPAQAKNLLPDVGLEINERQFVEEEGKFDAVISGVAGRPGIEGRVSAGQSWTFVEGALRKGSLGGVVKEANWRLFPLAGKDAQEILGKADSLRHSLQMGARLSDLSRGALEAFRHAGSGDKAAVLLARSAEELYKEITRALGGIPAAAQTGGLWQTPNGSAFAAQPLGAGAKVAFVYPGGFNSYPQIGRDLFFWFPGLYESMESITKDLALDLHEELLYPWRENNEGAGDRLALADDPVAMLTSGTTLSILYTQIMEGTFGLHPSMAFGYSLGENSMLFSSGVWRNGDEMVRALAESEVFKTELAGPQRTVRRAWGWSEGEEGPVWSNFLLMAPAERVQEAVAREKTVYLTHVNSPGQVMIGGEREASLRVAHNLGCRALEASFNVALHCRVVEAQREALHALHDWPVQGQPNAQLFSAAAYGPLTIERRAIASSMAQMLVSPLDFVRLVQTVYGEGARVFVELGAGSNCSRWIDETLKGEPHVAVSINHRGVDDLQGILRVVARLLSERVPIRLSAFE